MGTRSRWLKAMPLAALERRGRAVFRHSGRQIAVFRTPGGVFACSNRCPHEGYPLSEGSLDGGCVLTCNWHNWKFDLRDGANLRRGDPVRVYPAELRDGHVWVDVAAAPLDERVRRTMGHLRTAFDEHDYGRLARELGRLMVAGADPLDAVTEAIGWSYDRLEEGWTHAYAGTADWLVLYDELAGDREARLSCVLEAIGHIAYDTLRQDRYPYPEGSRPYDEEGFVAAVEAEDEAGAAAMVRGAVATGLGFPAVERGLTRAALAHYQDFGHALIYVTKAGRLIERLGPAVAEPLLLALARSLVHAMREDLIPEFRGYAAALAAWGRSRRRHAPALADLTELGLKPILALVSRHGAAPPAVLYEALLATNARHMLCFDLSFQQQVDGPISENTGWLDFTHGITFASAVRHQCTKFPELWPAGLLQMACFAGRNRAFTDPEQDISRWQVDEVETFLEASVAQLFDHAQPEYIASVHLLKTVLAAREELRASADPAIQTILPAALNRFLHSPLKRKHLRRTVRQALKVAGREA